MGEPTIYKPSIYKGAGIYNNGAGGGGGGDETVEIGGKVYPVVTIDGKKWLGEHLALMIDDAAINPGSVSTSVKQIWYNSLAAEFGYGYLYNYRSVSYIEQNKAQLIPGWRVPTSAELQSLINFAGGSNGFINTFLNKGWRTQSTDEYKFNLLPSGYGTSGIYDLSITPNSGSGTIMSITNDGSDYHLRYSPSSASVTANAAGGRSVRLIKDE